MVETFTIQNFVLTERDFRKISKLVYEHCGINLHDDKKELVRARLTKRLRKGNFKTFSDYIKHVLEDKTGNEFSILVDSISTNVTSFSVRGSILSFCKRDSCRRCWNENEKAATLGYAPGVPPAHPGKKPIRWLSLCSMPFKGRADGILKS